MTDRLEQAHKAFDEALRELVAATEDYYETPEAWTVTDYVIVVGQQRFTDAGVRVGEVTLIEPSAGQPDWVTRALLREAGQVALDSEVVE